MEQTVTITVDDVEQDVTVSQPSGMEHLWLLSLMPTEQEIQAYGITPDVIEFMEETLTIMTGLSHKELDMITLSDTMTLHRTCMDVLNESFDSVDETDTVGTDLDLSMDSSFELDLSEWE